jgi:hypothetical protein
MRNSVIVSTAPLVRSFGAGPGGSAPPSAPLRLTGVAALPVTIGGELVFPTATGRVRATPSGGKPRPTSTATQPRCNSMPTEIGVSMRHN